MYLKRIFIFFCFILELKLAAQQPVYTMVYNIKDTFDYASFTFNYNNKSYLERLSTSGKTSEFYTQIDLKGVELNRFNLIPKLGFVKYTFFATQVGSKLFAVGREDDTTGIKGNLLILNNNLSVFKDTVFNNYPYIVINVCRYDYKRNKVLAIYSYGIHKDSFIQRWGIMEFDTLGHLFRMKDIPPIVKFEIGDNLLVTSDNGYLVSGKLNGLTTPIDPFFVKLDTNFNTVWRTDLISTGKKYFTQYFSENLIELPNNKGYVYSGEMQTGTHNNCNYFDHFTTLHFINPSGLVTKNYYHNLDNKNCESSRPKGLFLKNDSLLMIFTQRDTTFDGIITPKDSASSLVIHYNFNQHRVVKEIIGGQLLNGKTSWILPGFSGVCFRTHVGRDIDGGFLTSGWADIMDNNGTAAYLMKTDSCGYTQDHRCKLVYRIGQQVNKSLSLSIDDSLSVLCQPIWTIENKKYTNPEIIHSFSSWGWHKVKLWGFAGSTTDSTEFDVYIDSTKTGIEPVTISYLNIYPNPASDILYIQTIDTKNIDYNITDLMGRVIKSDKYIDKIDISRLDNGVYFIELINDKKQRQVQKIVIKR